LPIETEVAARTADAEFAVVVGAVGNHDFGGPLAVLGDDGPGRAEFEDHEGVEG
jgi:hypothetical protein